MNNTGVPLTMKFSGVAQHIAKTFYFFTYALPITRPIVFLAPTSFK